MKPLKLKVEDNSLIIEWDTGNKSGIKLTDLRRACPCAECAAERETQSSSYIPLYSDEEIKLENIDVVGRYALSLKWKDGHSTGVYEYNMLASFNQADFKI